jgi:class 3 adenylate cyclase
MKYWPALDGLRAFAVFGAPLPVEDHPRLALECAIEIQRRSPELDAELAHLGIHPMQFGIGMNSGEIVIPEAMRDRLSAPPEMSSTGRVHLKGLREPVPLYKVPVDKSVAVLSTRENPHMAFDAVFLARVLG